MNARRLAIVGAGVMFGAAAMFAYRGARARALVSTDSGEGDAAWYDSLLSPLYKIEGIMGKTLSPAGIAALKKRESFSSTPYRDADGYSIGYGHFIKPGESFSIISEEEGAQLLAGDVADAEDAVNSLVSVELSQSAFDALVSLVYNIGAGAFRRSTLLKLLNAGDVAGAAEQFKRWNRSRGEVLTALVARRDSERAQFLA